MLGITTKKNYNACIYIRLSKEDKDKNNESLSVTNQRNVLLEYIKKNNYNLVDIYVDDGYTGTNFNRPSFKRMINDIEKGLIDLVITKDLSRLGRDYIKTGEYIEKYFPLHGVRYIALLDGIDTYLDSSNNDIAPFKAIINDMYSKDNSKKIRSALRTMQENGKWVGGGIPLGYMKDPNDKNHLIPCDREADIVKAIFSYAKNGLSISEIKEELIKNKIPTASLLRRTNRGGIISKSGIWDIKTIKNILSNRVYLGDTIQNKTNRISYKVRKNIKNDEDKWIIRKNTHIPLIDYSTFEFVNNKYFNLKRIRTHKETYRLFDSILYCGDCKHKLSILKPRKKDNKTYLVCNNYRMNSKANVCTSHSFNYDILEFSLKSFIRSFILKYLSMEDVDNIVKDIYKKNSSFSNKELLSMIDKKRSQLDKVYLDKLEGVINEDMYKRISLSINNELIKLEKENSLKSPKIDINLIMEKFLNLNFSRNLIRLLVKKIEVYNDKKVKLYLNF